MPPAAPTIDRETLLQALDRLGEILRRHKQVGEIAAYGGSAILLQFDWREGLRDVDVVVRECARARRIRATAMSAAQGAWGARPAELAEVERASAGDWGRFSRAIGELVDEMNARPEAERPAMLAPAPDLAGPPWESAWLCAAAEHLARRCGVQPPAWSERAAGFALAAPWFPPQIEAMKPVLIVESPTAFRRRMLFVGANVLSRA